MTAAADRPAGSMRIPRTMTPLGAPIELVVIGASLGGLEALQVLLTRLPPELPPIVVVLHRAADMSDGLGTLLGERCSLPVVEPDDKTAIVKGHVYLAPGDYHLLVERGWFSLSSDGPVRYARPSIDVLLESAADAYRSKLLALLLTCASTDGVNGAIAVRRTGGRVLVQEPNEARSPILPQAVIDAGVANLIAPLEDLRRETIRLCLGA